MIRREGAEGALGDSDLDAAQSRGFARNPRVLVVAARHKILQTRRRNQATHPTPRGRPRPPEVMLRNCRLPLGNGRWILRFGTQPTGLARKPRDRVIKVTDSPIAWTAQPRPLQVALRGLNLALTHSNHDRLQIRTSRQKPLGMGMSQVMHPNMESQLHLLQPHRPMTYEARLRG